MKSLGNGINIFCVFLRSLFFLLYSFIVIFVAKVLLKKLKKSVKLYSSRNQLYVVSWRVREKEKGFFTRVVRLIDDEVVTYIIHSVSTYNFYWVSRAAFQGKSIKTRKNRFMENIWVNHYRIFDSYLRNLFNKSFVIQSP